MNAWTFSLWLASIAAACVAGTWWERRKGRKAQNEHLAAIDRHWNESEADFEEAVRRIREADRLRPAAPGQPSVYDLNITGTIGGGAGKEPA